jgi:glycosyltransferase involved in cell wall biosynthesis
VLPEVKALLTPPADLATIAERWQRRGEPVSLTEAVDLLKVIQAGSPTSRPLLLAITHDDYHRNTGGIQTCLGREEQSSASLSFDYLVAFPWQPLPQMAATGTDPILGLIYNKRLIGYCRSSALVSIVGSLHDSNRRVHVALHQLMGHCLEIVADLVEASGSRSCWFWVHDFFSICPNFTLRRNNTAFCGAPEMSSTSCHVCVYGKDRPAHHARMRDFFGRLDIHVIAPSQSALALWHARSGLTAATERINPHIDLTWHQRDVPLPLDQSSPVRVAFVGMPVEHKGWPTFQRLLNAAAHDRRYQFFTFGLEAPRDEGRAPIIRHVGVNVTPGAPLAMATALEEHGIDLIVQWSAARETFSLTTHEGLESGAYILTNQTSGNVTTVVENLKRGAVFADEDELLAFFAGSQAEKLGRKARAERAEWRVQRRMSDMTLTYLAQDA